jgi:hypothetical protein
MSCMCLLPVVMITQDPQIVDPRAVSMLWSNRTSSGRRFWAYERRDRWSPGKRERFPEGNPGSRFDCDPRLRVLGSSQALSPKERPRQAWPGRPPPRKGAVNGARAGSQIEQWW